MQPTYNYGTATEASSEKVFLTMLESKFVECNKFMISSHLVAGIHKIQKGPVEKHPCSKRTDFACGSGPTTFLVNTAGRVSPITGSFLTQRHRALVVNQGPM